MLYEVITEGIGLEAQQLMHSPQLIPSHIILATLINALGKVAEPYVLVLDDYQFITDVITSYSIHYTKLYENASLHLFQKRNLLRLNKYTPMLPPYQTILYPKG